jgi:hypothetical protein
MKGSWQAANSVWDRKFVAIEESRIAGNVNVSRKTL